MVIKENKEVRERGLCRKLVENGFGDIKVKAGESIITSIKSILMSGNRTLKKVIEDKEFKGILELYEDCSEYCFLEVEKYYSGGNLDIKRENVCDILMFCMSYNDEDIYNDCIDFIKNNVDDDILIKLIDISHRFTYGLKEIEELKMTEFEKRGYKYLYNDEYLMMLDINNLKSLLSFKNVIIRNELWLLNRLLEWYKHKRSCNNNDDFVNDFKHLVEEHIDGKMINECEMSDETKEMLRELNIVFNKNKSIKYTDLNQIRDESMKNLIINNYIENGGIEFNEEEKEILNQTKEEELDNIILNLLETRDVIVTEIVLMIMKYKNVKVEKYISNIEKRDVLSKLCVEFNENKRNRTLKCLSVFLEDKKNVSVIEDICGKETLYRILNNDYLNSKSKELLIEYIQEMKMSDEEKEEMKKMIFNKELLNELIIKEITSFSYPETEYSFYEGEEISIIPSCDGDKCEFSVNPSLLDGLVIDKESGIIHGITKNGYEKTVYEITCKNKKNEKTFKITLEIMEVKFINNDKNDVSILSEGKKITKHVDRSSLCYLNLKMERGIYHIKYVYQKNFSGCKDLMYLGLSTDNIYFTQTCNYVVYTGASQDIASCCYIGTVVTRNPNFTHCSSDVIYELIVDMNKHEFWISCNSLPPSLLVKNLPSPLYPCVMLFNKNTSLELKEVSHED